jgi:hypothetical protein
MFEIDPESVLGAARELQAMIEAHFKVGVLGALADGKVPPADAIASAGHPMVESELSNFCATSSRATAEIAQSAADLAARLPVAVQQYVSSDGVVASKAAARERVAAAAAAVARTPGGIQRMGAAGEAADEKGFQQRGVAAFNLNGLTSKGNAKNMPTVDFITSEGFVSSKARVGWTYNPVLTRGRLGQYRKDLGRLLDVPWARPSVDRSQSRAAAAALMDPRNADDIRAMQAAGAWPRGLSTTPTVDEVAAHIRDHGWLSIPEDHVPQVQEYLRGYIRVLPDYFGFPDGVTPADEQVEQLVSRVGSNGISSAEIFRLVQEALAAERQQNR